MNLSFRSAFSLVGLVVLVGFIAGCATTSKLRSTKQNPAATATAKLKGPDNNDNMTLIVDADHLAPPQKISTNLKTYVVWTRSVGQKEWTNAGRLSLSGNRTASLKTTTPFSKLNLLITLEKSPTVKSPSEYIALEGSITAKKE